MESTKKEPAQRYSVQQRPIDGVVHAKNAKQPMPMATFYTEVEGQGFLENLERARLNFRFVVPGKRILNPESLAR